ncbi:MAG: hypothetical protein WC508_04435 [Patescibacteria group bacterium]
MLEKTNPQEEQPLSGIEKYRKWLSGGSPEIVEIEGKKYLKVYRGLEVPDRTTYSDSKPGDPYTTRHPGVVDLTEPGIDWSPILKYATEYTNAKRSQGWCVISALIPADDPNILRETIEDNMTLFEEVWGKYEDRPINQISDALMIVVSDKSCLKEVKIELFEGDFEKQT